MASMTSSSVGSHIGAFTTRPPCAVSVRRPLAPKLAPHLRTAGANQRAASVKTAAESPAAAGRMPKWDIVSGLLRESAVRSVSPQEAEKLVAAGSHVLIDVRPIAKFESAHPEGSMAAPMYQKPDLSKPDLGRIFRALALSLNGVQPMEPNPDFAAQLRTATAGGKGAIVMCEAGGTLSRSPNFPAGKPSRSLQGAYRAISEGVVPKEKVLHLDGGVYGWYKADLPFVGEYDTSDVGRTPNAAEKPTGQFYAETKDE